MKTKKEIKCNDKGTTAIYTRSSVPYNYKSKKQLDVSTSDILFNLVPNVTAIRGINKDIFVNDRNFAILTALIASSEAITAWGGISFPYWSVISSNSLLEIYRLLRDITEWSIKELKSRLYDSHIFISDEEKLYKFLYSIKKVKETLDDGEELVLYDIHKLIDALSTKFDLSSRYYFNNVTVASWFISLLSQETQDNIKECWTYEEDHDELIINMTLHNGERSMVCSNTNELRKRVMSNLKAYKSFIKDVEEHLYCDDKKKEEFMLSERMLFDIVDYISEK